MEFLAILKQWKPINAGNLQYITMDNILIHHGNCIAIRSGKLKEEKL